MKWEQFDCLGRKQKKIAKLILQRIMQALGVETLIPCVFNSCILWKKHVKTLMLFELAE